MIPQSFITEWANIAPWPERRQIEQDLIIMRALIELYSNASLRDKVAFRGGTALNKLFFKPAMRYSEDIDLVQTQAEPIGITLDLIQATLNGWLGKPKYDQSDKMITLSYRTTSEDGFPIKLKVEINAKKEQFSILGYQDYELTSMSRWFAGSASIKSYKLEELLGTKLRALYQRRKGRDLYDLYMALITFPGLNNNEILDCFVRYMEISEKKISRLEFLQNLEAKQSRKEFREDIIPLLQPGALYDQDAAYEFVRMNLIEKL